MGVGPHVLLPHPTHSMKIIRTVNALRRWRNQRASEGSLIGFVPTMGAFHAGHQSLMQRARRSCQSVIVSIFVNPLQFAPTEDLNRYPRPRKADMAICKNENVDVVFLPTQKEIYPSNFQTSVTVSRLSKHWEGAHRRTHFRGVTTVVAKLFNLVSPHRAYFGQKDYQQFCIIKRMVRDLQQNVKIVMCPTIREADGVALSSRNGYLSSSARRRAPILYQALQKGRIAIHEGKNSVAVIENVMRKHVQKDPKIKIDYLTACDADMLEPLREVQGKIVLLGAVHLGRVRLIDNILLKK